MEAMTIAQRNLLAAVVAEYLEPGQDGLSSGLEPVYASNVPAVPGFDRKYSECIGDFRFLHEQGYIGARWYYRADEGLYGGEYVVWPTAQGMFAIWGPR